MITHASFQAKNVQAGSPDIFISMVKTDKSEKLKGKPYDETTH